MGISVKNANLSFHPTLHLGTNSQQCLHVLARTSRTRHKGSIKGTDLKGLLPDPDNSVSLKVKVTAYLAPSCILQQLILHTSLQQKQVIQTPRPAGSPEEAQEAGSDGGMTHLGLPSSPGTGAQQ